MLFDQSVEEVLAALKSSPKGLTEADATERRRTHGFNELPEKKRSLVLLFLQQFHDILVYILIGAFALSLALPFFQGSSPALEEFLDAIAILGILLLNALLGFVQEYRAEQAIAQLRKLTSPTARVRRGGEEKIIPSRELVPGDIVIVEAGDRISADARILSASHLEVDESSLTGESRAVSKQVEAVKGDLPLAEQRNMIFTGTIVTKGSAEAVITGIGLQTEMGKVAKLVSETKAPPTPLEIRMKKLSEMIGGVVLALCVIVIGVGLFEEFPIDQMLLTGASLAVSAVPEGLPAVVTICFALGVRRMAKRHALVRRLDALETLGSVSVICSDKTGTITENKMEVVDTWIEGKEGNEGIEEKKKLLALIMASCNRAVLPNLGDPTELGLLRLAEKEKVERIQIDDEEVPFTSEEKYMQTRHSNRVFLKGAPEKILELADVNGDKQAILAANEAMAKKGLRVLAAAVHENGSVKPTFVGLVGMEDPPRPGIKEAIAQAKTAGIRTIMITGDHAETALAIAREIGLEGNVLNGKDLDTLSCEELAERLKTVSVFARVSPVHKLHILEALRMQGHVVSMTGDGVNDAPALKGAHVGVAMGKDGTQVAREAASIVLADDNYATIVNAIREGRRIYDNIRKFVLFLLRSNFDEILFITTTILLKIPLPYLPIHLLWINLMTDSLPALALGMEPEEEDIMRRPPRPPNEHPLSGEWGRLAVAAVAAYLVAFLYYFWQLRLGVPVEEARTATLMLAILFELFMAFSTRSRRPLLEIGIFSNRWMVSAVAITLAIQLFVMYTPLHHFLHLVPLEPYEWIELVLLSLTGFLVFEALKYLQKRSPAIAPRSS